MKEEQVQVEPTRPDRPGVRFTASGKFLGLRPIFPGGETGSRLPGRLPGQSCPKQLYTRRSILSFQAFAGHLLWDIKRRATIKNSGLYSDNVRDSGRRSGTAAGSQFLQPGTDILAKEQRDRQGGEELREGPGSPDPPASPRPPVRRPIRKRKRSSVRSPPLHPVLSVRSSAFLRPSAGHVPGIPPGAESSESSRDDPFRVGHPKLPRDELGEEGIAESPKFHILLHAGHNSPMQ